MDADDIDTSFLQKVGLLPQRVNGIRNKANSLPVETGSCSLLHLIVLQFRILDSFLGLGYDQPSQVVS